MSFEISKSLNKGFTKVILKKLLTFHVTKALLHKLYAKDKPNDSIKAVDYISKDVETQFSKTFDKSNGCS